MKLYAYEIHYSSIKQKESILREFKKLKVDKYICFYEGEKIKFIRLGLRDIKLNIKKRFFEKLNKINGYDKYNDCHPPKWHYEIELMKYLAHNMKNEIDKFFLENENVFKKQLSTRQYDSQNYPIDIKKRATINSEDWVHTIHHIFNMCGYDYDTEVFILNKISNGLHYNLHLSNRKQLMKNIDKSLSKR